MVLAALESSYVTVGMVGLARVRPAPLVVGFGIVVSTLLLFSVYYVRTNISRRRRDSPEWRSDGGIRLPAAARVPRPGRPSPPAAVT
jgi:hypothetical protein